MTVPQFQKRIQAKLQEIYPESDVLCEWRSMASVPDVYCPKCDVAVGPFAETEKLGDQYGILLDATTSFIKRLVRLNNANTSRENLQYPDVTQSFTSVRNANRNARCLIAIEIENTTGKKHVIGSMVNAGALGRVGLMIAWTPDKLEAFIKLRNYLKYLKRAEKNTFSTDNILILTRSQLEQSLRRRN